MYVLICVCEYTCKGQRQNSSALLCYFPPYSLEAGSYSELGVRLVFSDISISPLCFYTRRPWVAGTVHGHFWVYVNVDAGIRTLRLAQQVLLTIFPDLEKFTYQTCKMST